jgi:hypothetical protein
MVWSNTSLVLYHGTIGPYADAISKKIELRACNPNRDFGRGFYTTRIQTQARRFATFKYREALFDHQKNGTIHPQEAAVVEFEINLASLAGLDALVFVQPIADWRSFIRHCRRTGQSHKPNNNHYQAVYGPVGSSRGVIPGHEQLSFHDDYAISLLNWVRAEKWTPP